MPPILWPVELWSLELLFDVLPPACPVPGLPLFAVPPLFGIGELVGSFPCSASFCCCCFCCCEVVPPAVEPFELLFVPFLFDGKLFLFDVPPCSLSFCCCCFCC